MSWHVADLLPHEPPMVLLDELVAFTAESLTAAVTIKTGSPFAAAQGVPAHVGLEYMAQACGAFSGLSRRLAGTPPRVGFLLGTRRYLCQVEWFHPGDRLLVDVSPSFLDGQIGVFDCRLSLAGQVIATAQLTVAHAEEETA